MSEPVETVLPNGLSILCNNPVDALGMYQEIFENGAYDEAMSHLKPGDTVIDVGAHLGLASIRFASVDPSLRIFACEPAPPLFECLEANLRDHAPASVALNAAVGAEPGETTLVYYAHPGLTSMSTVEVDDDDTRHNIDTILANMGFADAGMRSQVIADGLKSALTFTVPLLTVAQVVAENDIDEVALLKIDVERAELAVLGGVDEPTWARIRAVVIEVHALDDRLARVEGLLKEHGFVVRAGQDEAMAGSTVYNVLARRD